MCQNFNGIIKRTNLISEFDIDMHIQAKMNIIKIK